MNARVILAPEKEIPLMRGYPWISPKAIAKEFGVKTGEWVLVYDSNEVLLAQGFYNANSLYRIRILSRVGEAIEFGDLAALVAHRLNQAKTVRELLLLPNDTTNAYRVFNSEADGLSGLTVDRFNDYLVVSSTAFWVENNRELICSQLEKLYPNLKVLWASHRKSLEQEGWEGVIEWAVSDRTTALELGIKFNIDFANAQKTGLFLDQRENHERIARLAKGRSVLDLYSYTGGFALLSAKAGAFKVTAVDSSAEAIVKGQENALLNGLDNITFIEADSRDYLIHAGDYDIVILDPPKLVPSKRHLEKAKNYYRFLHRELFKVMKTGSILMTCNCSSALTSADFTQLVAHQALAVGREIRILGVYGPSVCHPILNGFAEGQYLTAVLLVIV